MKRLHVKFIKWISNKFGYKIVMLKAKNGTTTIEGDGEVLPYIDISGYFFKKEPLKRTYPKFVEPEPINHVIFRNTVRNIFKRAPQLKIEF